MSLVSLLHFFPSHMCFLFFIVWFLLLTPIHRHVYRLAGKNRRLTFIECNNDMNSMIDVGKIADLVRDLL